SKEALVDEDDKDCTGSNISPLMEACHNGFYNIICALIRNKADQCLMNQNGWTAGDYLEGFMKSSLMDKSEKAKFLHILKVLRANEAKDERIKNREKRNDLPNAPPKKELPKLRTRPQEKSGGEMLKEAVAGVGRRNNFQRFAPPPISREYNVKNDDDGMLEDEDFLAPESDEDEEIKTKRSESISKDSDILSLTKMVDMNSLSLTQQRFNVEARELDLSFSESVSNVSVTLNLHQYLTKLCLKGSDFDDDITEVVDAICACSKLVELDLSQVEQIQSIHANKILKSCLKLKILDLYGTSVKVLDLQGKYVLEHLNISKTPFEFSDGFYQQINDLQTLSFLDVSLTAVDMNVLLSTISPSRLKISIKAAPILSHINLHQLSTIFSRFT
uniref:Uncharacterized protein n=1 Tax=Panagrolaimus sp. ES5 TaxID=591445 RepID=A0AC34G619_9BILA